MNAKHYVSLEAAKKLKELGCSQKCGYFYTNNGDIEDALSLYHKGNFPNNMDRHFARLSLLEAMDWLESKDIHLEIRMQHCKVKGDPYKIADDDEYQWKYYFAICKGSDVMNPIVEVDKDDYVILYTDRNECMQKAIEKELELL